MDFNVRLMSLIYARQTAGGHPEVPHPSGLSDLFDVLVDVRGQVVVDHVVDLYVQTPGSHSNSDLS